MRKHFNRFFSNRSFLTIFFACLFATVLTFTMSALLQPHLAQAAAVGEPCDGTGSVNDCDQLECAVVTCSSTTGTGICQITASTGGANCCNVCGNGICESSSPHITGGENRNTCPIDCFPGNIQAGDNRLLTNNNCTAEASACSTTPDGCCPGIAICPNDPDCSICQDFCSLEGSGGGNGLARGCGSASPPCASVVASSTLQTVKPFSLAQWLGMFMIPGAIYTIRRSIRKKQLLN